MVDISYNIQSLEWNKNLPLYKKCISDTVNQIFATSFSADDVEDNLKGNSEYRKLQYDLYQLIQHLQLQDLIFQ